MNIPALPIPQEPNNLKLDAQLCFPLYAATHTLIKLYYPALNSLGLTYPQYLVMLVLWEHNGLMVTEIGRALRLDTGTLTPLLKRLEKAELVERHRPADDKRRVVILLTKQGMALQERAKKLPLALSDFGKGAGCTQADIQQLKNDLYALIDKLDKIKA